MRLGHIPVNKILLVPTFLWEMTLQMSILVTILMVELVLPERQVNLL